jgi:hypothetical protein
MKRIAKYTVLLGAVWLMGCGPLNSSTNSISSLEGVATLHKLTILTGENNPRLASGPDLDQALSEAAQLFSRDRTLEIKLVRAPWNQHEAELRARLTLKEEKRSGVDVDLVLVDPSLASGLRADELILSLSEVGLMPRSENVSEEGSFFPLARAGNYAVGLAITRSAMEQGRAEIAAQFIKYLSDIFPERGLPDLGLAHIQVMESTPEGHALLEMAVQNTGDTPAFDVPILLTDHGARFANEIFLDVIEPGEIRYIRTEVFLPDQDKARISAVLDPEDLIRELNEFNNVAMIDVVFQFISGNPQPPKVSVAAFTIESKVGAWGVRGANAQVATDGTDYMTLWAQQKPGVYNTLDKRIVGAHYSSSGVKKNATFVVNPTYGTVDQLHLEYGGGNYMALWILHHGYGTPHVLQVARINPTGTVLDTTPIKVASTNDVSGSNDVEFANIAWTGKDFLVVYQNKYGIFGRLISTSGSVGSEFTIAATTSTWDPYYFTGLAYTPSKDQGYIMVEAAGAGLDLNLSGIWFTRKGNTITATKLLVLYKYTLTTSTWTNRLDVPRVHGNDSGNYLAVWHNYLKKKFPDIHGSLVTGQPSMVTTPLYALAAGLSEDWPSLTYDGSDYIMAYVHLEGCLAYVGSMRISPAGLKSATTFYNDTNADLVVDVDIASNGTNAFIIFEQQVPPSAPNGPDLSMDVMGMIVQ